LRFVISFRFLPEACINLAEISPSQQHSNDVFLLQARKT